MKRRYFCDNKIMFRCDTEVGGLAIVAPSFAEEVEAILKTKSIDCIILSYYNKGVLTAQVCQDIIRLGNLYGVFTCVDPKQDYTKYKGCSLIKPNRKEACALLQLDAKTPLIDLHKRMFELIGPKYSVIKLGEHGITLYDGSSMIHERPAARKIIDVTGAGDIVCAIMGYFLCSPAAVPSKILQLATRIATKSVEFPGTYTLTRGDLLPSSKVVEFTDHRSLKAGLRPLT